MIFLAAIISFSITFFMIPVVIKIMRAVDIMDAPANRKVHKFHTPSLGGAAMFVGIFISVSFFVPFEVLAQHKFLLAGILLVFVLGMRDDISSLYAEQKLIIQVIASFLTVRYAQLEIVSLHGIFGISTLSSWGSLALSLFVFLALTNAFNLIDGIDGLAGSLAVLFSTVFGAWFLLNGDTFYTILCFSVASASAAFLIFNWNPAKIFMGDTGSIFLGFIFCAVAIKFINTNFLLPEVTPWKINNYVAFSFAALIVPIYDTIRVFIIRISSGRSPFHPDKKHLHHLLIKQGATHSQATIILVSFNAIVLLAVWQLPWLQQTVTILICLALCLLFSTILELRLIRYRKKVGVVDPA